MGTVATTASMESIIVLLGLFSCASALVVPGQHVYRTYHAQDELGAYHFGHSGGPSSRDETRDHLGVVRGAYNWVGDGTVQMFTYISDGTGYRLLSSYIDPELVAPEPVEETAEVRAAREKLEAVYKAALERAAAVPAPSIATV